MRKILVIEDKQGEKEKARKAVEEKGYYCFVAEDYHQALLELGTKEDLEKTEEEFGRGSFSGRETKINWDGVITDIHFPLLTPYREEPYGADIMHICREQNIPCVVCTDVGGHAPRWVMAVAQRIGIAVVEAKNWQRAVELLSQKLK